MTAKEIIEKLRNAHDGWVRGCEKDRKRCSKEFDALFQLAKRHPELKHKAISDLFRLISIRPEEHDD